MEYIKTEYWDIEDDKIDSESKTDNKTHQSFERPYDKTYCTLKNLITSNYGAKNENDIKIFKQESKENGSDHEQQKDKENSMIDDTFDVKNEDSNSNEVTQDFTGKVFHYKPNNEAKTLEEGRIEKGCRYQLSQSEENAMMLDMTLDPTMENNTGPILDPEEDERQKCNEMFKNCLTLRSRVLQMEINQAKDDLADDRDNSVIGQVYDILEKAWDEVNASNTCFFHGNLDSSDMYLTKAEEIFKQLHPKIHNKKSSNDNQDANDSILKHVKPKNYQPGNRDKVTVVGNKEDIRKCLAVAEKAMTGRNFEKAKRFLHKSQRIFHTAAAEMLLQQIRVVEEAQLSVKMKEDTNTNKTESTENIAGTSKDIEEKQVSTKVTEESKENEVSKNVNASRPLKRSISDLHSPAARKRRAINCLTQAKEALSSNDINAAIKLAKKSQLANPSPAAEEFLAKVRDMDASTSTLEDNTKSYADSVKNNEPPERQADDSDKKRTKTQETKTDNEEEGAKVIETEIFRRDATKSLINKNYPKYETHAKKALESHPASRTKTTFHYNREEKVKITLKKNKTTKSYSRNDHSTVNKIYDTVEITSDSSDEELEKSDKSKKNTTDRKNNTERDDDAKKPGVFKKFIGYTKRLVLGNKDKLEKSKSNSDQHTDDSEAGSSSKPDKNCYSSDEKNTVLKRRFGKVYEAQAYKMIESAEDALRNKNFKQAENILKRSQKLYKTPEAERIMKYLQQNVEEAYCSEGEDSQNEIHGQELIVAATSAINKKDYDFAEMLLKIASIKHESEFAAELLPVVQQENIFHPYCNRKRSLPLLKTLAERYVEIAQDMESKELLWNVEDILIIAQNTHPTDVAKELLINVRNKLYSRNANSVGRSAHYEWEAHKKAKQGHPVGSEVYKSNCYVEIAQRAFIMSEYVAAEALLCEAQQLNPCIEIKHLRMQANQANHRYSGLCWNKC